MNKKPKTFGQKVKVTNFKKKLRLGRFEPTADTLMLSQTKNDRFRNKWQFITVETIKNFSKKKEVALTLI